MKAAPPPGPGNKGVDLLLRHELPPSQISTKDSSIDANRIARWLDGGVTEEEREDFQFEAAASTRTRRILRHFDKHTPTHPHELRRAEDSSAWPWLIGFIPIILVAIWFLRSPTSGVQHAIENRLEREAAALGFRPLTLRELLTSPPPLQVQGASDEVPLVTAQSPVGHVLAPQLAFRWTPADRPGVVVVRHVTGTIVCQVRGRAPLPLPSNYADQLEAGDTYIWELAPLDGSVAAIPRTFTMAGRTQRAQFARLRTTVHGKPLEQLLIAHYALRKDHVLAAEEPARRWLEQNPDSELALATLWQVLTRLESPEAKHIAQRLFDDNNNPRTRDGVGSSGTRLRNDASSSDTKD